MRRTIKLTTEEIINKWLGDYHNTTLAEVNKLHPDWAENPRDHTREFYSSYKVTDEQLKEWEDWLIQKLIKESGMSRTYVKRSMWSIYLNTAPRTF